MTQSYILFIRMVFKMRIKHFILQKSYIIFEQFYVLFKNLKYLSFIAK